MLGNIIQFGGYDWRVLDVQDDQKLIITEDIIGFRRYHHRQEAVTWATSEIRHWLNSGFFNSFTQAERERILQTTVINNSNPWWGRRGGDNTADRIFLLSLD